MHGNASARVEVLPQLTVLLALGVAVFAFDFAGSGKSDGEHVTLGYFEREDLLCVVAHLRATDVVSTIALWGRSMGAGGSFCRDGTIFRRGSTWCRQSKASSSNLLLDHIFHLHLFPLLSHLITLSVSKVTALMHGDRDPSIAGMVLDSPFSDLTRLCEEMVDKARDQGINVPGFVSSVAIRALRGSVRRQADFDIKDVSPITHVPHCFIPALFVAAENDDFITKAHSLSLHDAYAGDANMIVVEGDHNSSRPRFMFDSVSIFLQACLQIPTEWQFQLHPSMNVMMPPWRFPGVQSQYDPSGNLAQSATSQQQQPMASRRQSQQQPMHTVTSPTRQSIVEDDGDSDEKDKNGAEFLARLDFADDDYDDDDDDGSVEIEEIDTENLGMTTERQREIQGSLFRMLGHDNGAAGEKR